MRFGTWDYWVSGVCLVDKSWLWEAQLTAGQNWPKSKLINYATSDSMLKVIFTVTQCESQTYRKGQVVKLGISLFAWEKEFEKMFWEYEKKPYLKPLRTRWSDKRCKQNFVDHNIRSELLAKLFVKRLRNINSFSLTMMLIFNIES